MRRYFFAMLIIERGNEKIGVLRSCLSRLAVNLIGFKPLVVSLKKPEHMYYWALLEVAYYLIRTGGPRNLESWTHAVNSSFITLSSLVLMIYLTGLMEEARNLILIAMDS